MVRALQKPDSRELEVEAKVEMKVGVEVEVEVEVEAEVDDREYILVYKWLARMVVYSTQKVLLECRYCSEIMLGSRYKFLVA